MKTAKKKKVLKALETVGDLLVKCGGPGGTPGPCPAGGGKKPPKKDNKNPYHKVADWAESQPGWKGNITTEAKKVDTKLLSPNQNVSLSDKMIKKHESKILSELENHGSLRTPVPVSKRSDGRYFIHGDSGNHRFEALKNLKKSGAISSEDLQSHPVVEVKPKKGWKFETTTSGNLHRPYEALVPDSMSVQG